MSDIKSLPESELKKFFQISVKGLVFDDQNRVMMVRDVSDFWELPGGRIESEEELVDALVRECKEEMGVECEVLDKHPFLAWSAIDRAGFPRITVCYKIKFNSFDFVYSEECQEYKFFAKEEIAALKIRPQTEKLTSYL